MHQELSKPALRAQMRTMLRQMSVSEIERQSTKIILQLENNVVLNSAKSVLLFVPMADEPQILPLAQRWMASKEVFMPVLCGGTMTAGRCRSLNDLRTTNDFGILQCAPTLPLPPIDAAVVPALAFDSTNYRLGRGGGYYDRFFVETTMYKIGVCFDFQYLPHVPHSSWDIRVDEVCVEK